MMPPISRPGTSGRLVGASLEASSAGRARIRAGHDLRPRRCEGARRRFGRRKREAAAARAAAARPVAACEAAALVLVLPRLHRGLGGADRRAARLLPGAVEGLRAKLGLPRRAGGGSLQAMSSVAEFEVRGDQRCRGIRAVATPDRHRRGSTRVGLGPGLRCLADPPGRVRLRGRHGLERARAATAARIEYLIGAAAIHPSCGRFEREGV